MGGREGRDGRGWGWRVGVRDVSFLAYETHIQQSLIHEHILFIIFYQSAYIILVKFVQK